MRPRPEPKVRVIHQANWTLRIVLVLIAGAGICYFVLSKRPAPRIETARAETPAKRVETVAAPTVNTPPRDERLDALAAREKAYTESIPIAPTSTPPPVAFAPVAPMTNNEKLSVLQQEQIKAKAQGFADAAYEAVKLGNLKQAMSLYDEADKWYPGLTPKNRSLESMQRMWKSADDARIADRVYKSTQKPRAGSRYGD